VEGSNLAYRVKILNGDSQGQDRVSSGEVSLNGIIIVTPQQLNQQVSQITVPVTLQQSNILTVDLRSAVGRQLTVLVEPQ